MTRSNLQVVRSTSFEDLAIHERLRDLEVENRSLRQLLELQTEAIRAVRRFLANGGAQ